MKVIINSLTLSDIASAIRYVNNEVRSYKPSEMSSAIDLIPLVSGNNHAFRVTVNQSPHQTIIVRRYLPDIRQTHTTAFNVTEQFYLLDVSIEADDGYTAGTLNVTSPVLLDRDVMIKATDATPVGV